MEQVTNQVTLKIGGAAGEGIMVSGLLFSKACVRAGLKAFDYTEYPSLIRGGHNTYLVQISEEDIFSHDRSVEILIALDQYTVEQHAHELTKGGALIFDPDDKTISLPERKDIIAVPIPLKRIALQLAESDLMRNTVAIGASFALCEFPLELAIRMIKDIFASKSESVVNKNIETLRAGFDAVTKAQQQAFSWKILPLTPRNDLLIAGNESIALGALASGCMFYVAYPMTPSTSILHYFAEHGPKHGVVVKHAEDEISVINMAIGAGHMGVRSMCGTSGGGFALMTEGVGMAAMTETPVVIILAQRPGPSTGLPTWTGQGDLQFALHASQGDFPHFVVAPGDVEECFYFTSEAFNVAEEYQTPVILLTDKHLAECHQTVTPFDFNKIEIRRGKVMKSEEVASGVNFKRYDPTVADGVSPRTLPGTKGGIFVANSDEHDVYGYSAEDSKTVLSMMDKRARKVAAFAKKMSQPEVVGPESADVTFVFWGSVKGAVKEAVKMLHAHALSANTLQITWLSPFPTETVARILTSAKRVVLVESNQEGQLGDLIAEKTGILIKEKILKYDGRPFFPEEIVEQIIHTPHGIN